MKKKVYQKPLLMSEDFVPQEYVAACWTLACTQGTTMDKAPSGYDADIIKTGYMDHTGACSDLTKNVISDSGGKITVYENNPQEGWLVCTVTNPSSWVNITPGMTVEWTTSITYAPFRGCPNGKKIWHHKGVAGEAMPGHPLMS